jgi:hypothetical protein
MEIEGKMRDCELISWACRNKNFQLYHCPELGEDSCRLCYVLVKNRKKHVYMTNSIFREKDTAPVCVVDRYLWAVGGYFDQEREEKSIQDFESMLKEL